MGQLIAAGVVILVVLGWLALNALGHLIAAHLVISLVIICTGVPAAVAIVVALIRGLNHHVSLVYSGPRQLTRGMPAPAEIQAVPVAGRPADPFSADTPAAWEALIDEADREELTRQGRREARVVSRPCEGPGCGTALDDNPWEIEVDTEDGDPETHKFCSRECVDAWKRQDAGTRLDQERR